MTTEPGAKRSVEQGLLDLNSDTDSDDSDVNDSAFETEPGFGHFLLNFPYEELPEEKIWQIQTHRIMNFP